MNHRVQIAGLLTQIKILMWKLLITLRRNIIGSMLEILSPYIFVSILIVIRYFIERIKFKTFSYVPTNVLELHPMTVQQKRNLILFYPNNEVVRNLVNNAAKLLTLKNPDFLPIVFGVNVTSAISLQQSIIAKMAAFYSFPVNLTEYVPDNVKYSIFTQEDTLNRYKIDQIFPTKVEYLYNRAPEDFCLDSTYFSIYQSFNAFKYSMDLQLIANMTGTRIQNNNLVKLLQYYCPDFEQDELLSTFSFFPSLLISVAFMFTSVFTIGNIVAEKANKMKEYLKLVGIKWYAIYISWWIRNIIICSILSIVITITCKVFLTPNSNNPLLAPRAVFTNTNSIIVLIVLLVYSVQVVSFTLLLSQFFSTAFNAKVVLLIIWILTSVNFYDEIPTSVVKYLFSVFPNLGLVFSFQVLFQFERSSRAFNIPQLFDNIYDDPLRLGAILICMLSWSIIYFPLTWYLENILPGDFGIPLPFYFPLTKNYWFPQNILKNSKKYQQSLNSSDNSAFESEPFNLKKTVSISNLSKTFKTFRAYKTAVNNISINFYENQITGLLGHNGAGKTTTTFMLCGMYPPTSGNAKIMGLDLRNQMDQIRPILGFCPQVDILLDDFTVEEHLKLVSMIKGFPGNKLKTEIERISTFVGLQKDLYKKSKSLSGGMKRRLMVAMALIGDSKIIILDEPTSGLDPFNRVKLWELIRKYKNNHTIILTTHFMEEADALSDRIAIMNHGEIKCCGSPIFLKNYYGNGFRIKIVKNSNFNSIKFENMLREYLNDYKIEINVAAEFCLSFPFDKVNILPEFLNQLELNKDKFGLDSYSISSSTIEEVFLKIGKIDQNSDNVENNGNTQRDMVNIDDNAFTAFKEKIDLKQEKTLWIQQIKSLLYKRYIIFIRRYMLAFVILLGPLIFQLIIVTIIPSSNSVIDKIGKTENSYGSLNLDINKYDSHEIPYYTIDSNPDNTVNKILTNFYSYSNRPKINLIRVNNSVYDYVTNKHNKSLTSLLKEHYFGITWLSSVTSPSDINSFDITGYYSSTAYQTPGVLVNEISNLLLSFLNSNKLDKSIQTVNEPIPPDNNNYYGNNFLKYLGCFDVLPLSLFNFATSLVIGFIISINVMHVSKETINGSKKLQLLTNTNKFVYWFSNWIFDFIICFVNICLVIGITCLISSIRNNPDVDIYIMSSRPTVGYWFLVLIFSSFCWTFLAYFWLSFFKSDVTAFVILLLLLGVASFIDVVLSFFQLFNNLTNPDLSFDSPSTVIMFTMRMILAVVFPNVTIKRELFNFRLKSNRYCIDSLNRVLKSNFKYDTLYMDINEPGNGLFLLISVFQLIFMLLLLVGTETNAFNKDYLKNFIMNLFNAQPKYISMNTEMAEDVKEESERIQNSNLKKLSEHEPLIIKKTLKLFKKKKINIAAVDNLSLGVGSQSCFGLLGMNGAGKSTTFKIITGELEANQGEVLVNGHSVKSSNMKARQNLGYCPQFDRLIEYLTVKETLEFFSKLRGIDPMLSEKISKDMLSIFQLNEFKHVYVQNLSGGNKRKVSCAIAFIGKPSVVILDEPSTGMDPGARKFMWNIIKKARDTGMTIVLSSHSMEECEALCDKLGIMLNGQLQCLGTIPEIKSKYGDGYRLIIKCHHSDQLDLDILRIENFIRQEFPSAYLEDRQYETLFYIIKSEYKEKQNLSRMFSIIEENKVYLNIESYFISQTTLEQVFMSFANKSQNMINTINKTVLNNSKLVDLFDLKKDASANNKKIKLLSYKNYGFTDSNSFIF
nr:ATP-binding cassette subfamily A3-like 1 [Brachionus rubens]